LNGQAVNAITLLDRMTGRCLVGHGTEISKNEASEKAQTGDAFGQNGK
jgi:hypothetical protein